MSPHPDARRALRPHAGTIGDAPVIATARLVLRPPSGGDADAVAAAMADHEVARMLARVPQPYDRQEAVDWLERVGRGAADADAWHFALTEKAAAEKSAPLVGVVGLERRSGGMHLGYWLARSHWGGGLMSEAVEAVLGWYFGERPDDRVHSGVFVDNPASLGIQQKLGFAVIGRSDVFCRARGEMVGHVDTVVSATSFAGPSRRTA
jgi:RimJ/RimL family protein N-acetyltransferase